MSRGGLCSGALLRGAFIAQLSRNFRTEQTKAILENAEIPTRECARCWVESELRHLEGGTAFSEQSQRKFRSSAGAGEEKERACTDWLQFLGFELGVVSKLRGCPPGLVLRKTVLLLLIKHNGS